MGIRIAFLVLVVCSGCAPRPALPDAPLIEMPWVRVSADRRGFELEPSGKRFTPWGFNYDRDDRLRLIEDYWEQEWGTVAEDFAEMKSLGANVVRVHLQFGRFMDSPERANDASLARLRELTRLCAKLGLYLDLTGLGCYRADTTPGWYNALGEQQRWTAQANFWSAVAQTCADSPAVFAYDLMNEPVVPGSALPKGQWVDPHALAGLYYVQRIALDPAGRPRSQIAQAWISQLTSAIRKVDRRHLMTVGLLPTTQAGFVPRDIASQLDYLSVHVYPERDRLEHSVDLLSLFSVGRPVVVEEMFPLNCDAKDLEKFIAQSRSIAAGWIGFYWGRTPAELRRSKDPGDLLTLSWLEMFQKGRPAKGASERP